MRIIHNILINLLIINFITGCDQNRQKESSKVTVVSFADAKNFALSDFVESQRYILLSTDEEALFSRADKVIAKNDNYYLFDHLGNSGVLVFGSTGNFIRKIREFGEGPEQLKGISDFQVSENGEVQLLDQTGKSVVIYTPEGKYKERAELPVNVGGFAQFNDKWFLAINYDHQNDQLVKDQVLGVFDNSMEVDSLYFQYPKEAVNANVYYHAGVVASGKDRLIYHRPPNDTISIFAADGVLTDRVLIDFGDQRLPAEAVNDFQMVRDYKAADAYFQYLQTPALPVGDRIFGVIISTKNEFWTYVYELNSKELYTYKVDLNKLHLKDVILGSAAKNSKEVVSLIDPIAFSQDTDPAGYPMEVRKHLENEGSVLVIHTLKP